MVNDVLGWQSYIPHGHCYLWQWSLVSLHGVSDALIAIAYLFISATLFYAVWRRRETTFRSILLLFAGFILACGVGHFLDTWTLWFPNYRVTGVMKALTALISVVTAIKLWDWLPQLIALRSPQDLERLNQQLSAEMERRQQHQQMLQQVLQGTAATTGKAFLSALSHNLASALSVNYVFMAEVIEHAPRQLAILASWPEPHGSAPVVYDVAGTPCEQVLNSGQPQHYAANVQAQFPESQGLKCMDAECYLGLPIKDGQNHVLGVLYVCHDRPLEDGDTALAIMGLFADKVAAELQRQRAEMALQRAYDELEQRVQNRTTELAQANAHLQRLAIRISTTAAIVQRMRCSLDLNEIFATATTELRRALNCDRVLVYRFTADWSGYVVAETVAEGWEPCLRQRGDQPRDRRMLNTLHHEHCVVRLQDDGDNHLRDTHLQATQGGIYRQNVDYISVADVRAANFSPCYLELLASLQARAYLTIPIYVGNQLWGLLASYQNTGPHEWASGDIEMAVQIGGQLGVAIQQTELLNHSQNQATELQQAKEEADAANRAKGDFLAHMSHELRTPLNSILGFTQLLGRDTTLAPNHKRYVDIVNSSGEHLLGLINNILEMSKIEAGRQQRYDTDFELLPFLENIQAMLALKAQQKGLTFFLEQSLNLPDWIRTDQGKLRQVLLNLLGNAIKFTEVGHVRLRVEMDEAPLPPGTTACCCVRFEVEDSGPGIAPAELNQLFDAFRQTKAGLKSGQGTGLGLPISQRYVQLMEGDLTVDSTLGRGTRFMLTLPVQGRSRSPQQALSSTHSPAPPSLPPKAPYRILIAEDDAANCLLLQEHLAPLGAEVQTVADGESAIARWREWRPHLIWMDMQMPILDGREATRRIRQAEAQWGLKPTVILALTANALATERAKILAAGCDDLICKPFQGDHLLVVMRQHLAASHLPPLQPQSATPTGNAALTSEALKELSPAWIQALHRSACQCDDAKIRSLLKKLPADKASVATTLAHLAAIFQFDHIVAVTTPLLPEDMPLARRSEAHA